MDLNISTQTLNKAKDNATRIVAKAIVLYCNTDAKSWSALEARLGIKFPEAQYSLPCTRQTLDAWGSWYKNSVKQRLEESFGQMASGLISKEKAQISRIKDIDKKNLTALSSELSLLPEQEVVYQAILRDVIQDRKVRAALQDGKTGSGKTYIAVALAKYILDQQLHKKTTNGFYHYGTIMVLTPKTVMEAWSRLFEAVGLGHLLGSTIVVSSYSQLSATYGKMFLLEDTKIDPYSDKITTTYKWNPALVPYALFLDECHRLNNDTIQTKAIIAALTTVKNPPLSFWFSATPFVTVNNTRAFAIATGARLLDMTITPDNFTTFARLICAEPHKKNLAAAKRLREIFGKYIYSMPYVKWPHKAINSVVLVPFENEADRTLVNDAYNRYIEKCEKLGKNTSFGSFEKCVALGQLCLATEPVRMNQIARLVDNDVKSGTVAPVVGVQYRSSVIKLVFKLIELGYKREDISIIWGGKEQLKTSLVLESDELKTLMAKVQSGEYQLTKHDIKRITATLEFRESKLSYQETDNEATKRRHQLLADYGLTGLQNANQRQIEIDRFQNGESKLCIFTLASGGVGLSLDHNRPDLKPRKGYFTPIFSGIIFKQALGRLVRRMTLSDTFQYIVGMADSVEETYVMPKLDETLKCINTITDTTIDLIDFDKAVEVKSKIRSIEEALRDADSPDSQVQDIDDREDEEDDEMED